MRKRPWIFGIALILAATTLTGCPPTEPDPLPEKTYTLWNFHPYVLHDANYTSYICVANTSEWGMDATVTYRDAAGAVLATDKRRFAAHESYRYVPGAMEGSVEINAIGDIYALASHMEMRSATGDAAALAPSATTLGDYGIHWYYRTGVLDKKGANTRSKIIETNLYPTPIYLEFGPLPIDCPDLFDVKVNPYQLFMFQPADRFPEVGSNGLADWTVHSSGNTGPNRSGQQCGIHTGSVLTAGPDGISLDSYAQRNSLYWENWCHHYLADVQDDGVNRADRIYLKSNAGNDPDITQQQYNVHFYATDGNESIQVVSVYSMFDVTGSVKMISPRDLLGKDFKGSVWIECQSSTQAIVRRVAPGKWSDVSGASPAGSLISGCVPYVSTKDASWRYQLALFYPINIYPNVQIGPDIPPIRFVDPSQPEPDPKPGEVVLTFWNAQGGLEGWVVVFLTINGTAYVDVNSIASNYLKKPFEGSVAFNPHVVVEVELSSESGLAHGSANTWLSGQ